MQLLHGNGNGRGKLNGTGAAVDRDDMTVQGARAGIGVGGVPAARDGADSHGNHKASSHDSEDASAMNLAGENNAEQAEAQQPGGEKEALAVATVHGGAGRSGGNSKDGTRSAGTGSDRPGSE